MALRIPRFIRILRFLLPTPPGRPCPLAAPRPVVEAPRPAVRAAPGPPPPLPPLDGHEVDLIRPYFLAYERRRDLARGVPDLYPGDLLRWAG